MIKELWAKLKDHHKLAYVLLSRADREKTLYIARLNQIREELRQAYPQEFMESQGWQEGRLGQFSRGDEESEEH